MSAQWDGVKTEYGAQAAPPNGENAYRWSIGNPDTDAYVVLQRAHRALDEGAPQKEASVNAIGVVAAVFLFLPLSVLLQKFIKYQHLLSFDEGFAIIGSTVVALLGLVLLLLSIEIDLSHLTPSRIQMGTALLTERPIPQSVWPHPAGLAWVVAVTHPLPLAVPRRHPTVQVIAGHLAEPPPAGAP